MIPNSSVNIDDVATRAAEIAAEQGHPHNITTDNVTDAFREEVAAAQANAEMVKMCEQWLEENETK